MNCLDSISKNSRSSLDLSHYEITVNNSYTSQRCGCSRLCFGPSHSLSLACTSVRTNSEGVKGWTKNCVARLCVHSNFLQRKAHMEARCQSSGCAQCLTNTKFDAHTKFDANRFGHFFTYCFNISVADHLTYHSATSSRFGSLYSEFERY